MNSLKEILPAAECTPDTPLIQTYCGSDQGDECNAALPARCPKSSMRGFADAFELSTLMREDRDTPETVSSVINSSLGPSVTAGQYYHTDIICSQGCDCLFNRRPRKVSLHGIGRFLGYAKTYQIPNAERSSQYLLSRT